MEEIPNAPDLDRSQSSAEQPEPAPDDVASRADLLPEEERLGSADPEAQAAAILAESLERTEAPHDPPDGDGDPGHARDSEEHEHRRSEDTV